MCHFISGPTSQFAELQNCFYLLIKNTLKLRTRQLCLLLAKAKSSLVQTFYTTYHLRSDQIGTTIMTDVIKYKHIQQPRLNIL